MWDYGFKVICFLISDYRGVKLGKCFLEFILIILVYFLYFVLWFNFVNIDYIFCLDLMFYDLVIIIVSFRLVNI